jgi:hypothetical protein
MLNSLYSRLTPYQGNKHIIVNDQQVGDIITNLLKTHNQYKSEYDKIASHFEKRGNKAIARGIWGFIKTNIPYKIESDDKQKLKSPSAILYTANTTGSDCKNFSLFAGGILDALNRKGYPINWCYRFASYRLNDKLPHHVFVVINPGTNNEIWLDAVLPSFDLKKQYFYKIDKNPMALIAMSGVDYESIGASKKRQEKKAARKAAKPAKKAARKEKVKAAAKKVKEKIKKAGKVILKFAPPTVATRNAFLALVKLNVRSLATNLQKAMAKDNESIKKFWEGVGGKYDALQIAVSQGSKKKRLGGIGAAPAAAPAAVAAAAPLLVKIVDIFKKLGIKSEDIADIAGQAIKKIAQKKLDSINESAETGEETTASGTFDADAAESATGGGSNISPKTLDIEQTEESEGGGLTPTEENRMFAGVTNKTLLIGGAAALTALYFINKKK